MRLSCPDYRICIRVRRGKKPAVLLAPFSIVTEVAMLNAAG